MKTTDNDNTLAEVLNNYNHPLFDVAYAMLEDKEFYIVDKNYNDKQYETE